MRRTTIEDSLTGGDPRSLGRGNEVVELVLARPSRLPKLFECLFSDDEIVRMRGSDALEKVCRQRPDWLVPFTERLLTEVPNIKQPSVQWHLAQILSALPLESKDRRRAIVILKRNLATYDDWIVENLTLQARYVFAAQSRALRRTLIALLPRYVASPRRSVATRARRILAELQDPA